MEANIIPVVALGTFLPEVVYLREQLAQQLRRMLEIGYPHPSQTAAA